MADTRGTRRRNSRKASEDQASPETDVERLERLRRARKAGAPGSLPLSASSSRGSVRPSRAPWVLVGVLAALVVAALVWGLVGGGDEGGGEKKSAEPTGVASAEPTKSSAPVPEASPKEGENEVLAPPPFDGEPQKGVPRELGGAGGGTYKVGYSNSGKPKTEDPSTAILLRTTVWGSNVDTPPLTPEFLEGYAEERAGEVPVDNEKLSFFTPKNYVTVGADKKTKYLVVSVVNTHKYSLQNLAVDVQVFKQGSKDPVVIRNAVVEGVPSNLDKFMIFEVTDSEYKQLKTLPRDKVNLTVSGTHGLPEGDLVYNSDSWVYPLNG